MRVVMPSSTHLRSPPPPIEALDHAFPPDLKPSSPPPLTAPLTPTFPSSSAHHPLPGPDADLAEAGPGPPTLEEPDEGSPTPEPAFPSDPAPMYTAPSPVADSTTGSALDAAPVLPSSSPSQPSDPLATRPGSDPDNLPADHPADRDCSTLFASDETGARILDLGPPLAEPEPTSDPELSSPVQAPTRISQQTTISRGMYHQCGTARRVKVYEMVAGTWVDLGTGYCAGVYDEGSDRALLIAKHEASCTTLPITHSDVEEFQDVADDEMGDDAPRPKEKGDDQVRLSDPVEIHIEPGAAEDWAHKYVIVVSAEFNQEDLLLFSPLLQDDVYKQQQDTLIVWTEPSGKEMALSFQERSGCHQVWDFLVEVQKHIRTSDPEANTMDVSSSPRFETMGGESPTQTQEFMSFVEQVVGLRGVADLNNHQLLPSPELDNLSMIESMLKNVRSRIASCAADESGMGMFNGFSSDNGLAGMSPTQGTRVASMFRERFSDAIVQSRYLVSLGQVFTAAEEGEQLPALHAICTIVQDTLLLGDGHLFEHAVQDEVFPTLVGMLEYDPAFPRSKASYRDYLSHSTRFKEVVPISNPLVRAKIQHTYRLILLRDVVLNRILPDSLLNLLQSIIYIWQLDIVSWCLSDNAFLPALFELFSPRGSPVGPSPGPAGQAKRADAVLFLQALCNIGKTMQLSNRVQMCSQLVHRGLLDVIAFGLGLGLGLPLEGPGDSTDETRGRDSSPSAEAKDPDTSAPVSDTSSTLPGSAGCPRTSATTLSPTLSPGVSQPDLDHPPPEHTDKVDPAVAEDVRSGAAEMLLMLLELDPPAVRQYIVQRRQLHSFALATQSTAAATEARTRARPKHTYGKPRKAFPQALPPARVDPKDVELPNGNDLLQVVCSLLHTGEGMGIKSQMMDMLRSLLDPASEGGPSGAEKPTLLSLFYQEDVRTLFAPLLRLPPLTSLRTEKSPDQHGHGHTYRHLRPLGLDSSVLHAHLCDLLTYMLSSHGERAEEFFIATDLGAKVGTLLLSKDRPLVAAAMRCIKVCATRENARLQEYLLHADAIDALLHSLSVELASGRAGVVTSTAISLFHTLTTEERLRRLALGVLARYESKARLLAKHPSVATVFCDLVELTEAASSPSVASSPEVSLRITVPSLGEREEPLSDDEGLPRSSSPRKRKRLTTSSSTQLAKRGHVRSPSRSSPVGKWKSLVPYDEEDEEDSDLSLLGTRNLHRPNVLRRSGHNRRRADSGPPRPSRDILSSAGAYIDSPHSTAGEEPLLPHAPEADAGQPHDAPPHQPHSSTPTPDA